jgi:hypothetical protein
LASTAKYGAVSKADDAEAVAAENTAENTAAAVAPFSKRARKQLAQNHGGRSRSSDGGKSKIKFSLSPDAVYAQLMREGLVSTEELEKFYASHRSANGVNGGDNSAAANDIEKGKETSTRATTEQLVAPSVCSVHSMKPRRAAVSAIGKSTVSEMGEAKQSEETSPQAAVWGDAYTLRARVLLSGCVLPAVIVDSEGRFKHVARSVGKALVLMRLY